MRSVPRPLTSTEACCLALPKAHTARHSSERPPSATLRERERDPSPHLALHRVFTPHTTHTLYTPCTDTTKTIPPPSRPRIHGCRQPVACEMMRVGILINYLASAGMLALGSAAHE